MDIGLPSWQSDASNVGLFCYRPSLSGKCSGETGSLKVDQKVSIPFKQLGTACGFMSFSYDLNGNLLSVTDAKNQTTTYTYDAMDRLKSRTDALSRTENYEYDKIGNLTTFTDRKSQIVTFTYDNLNRRTGATYPDATVTFGYDAIGRLTSVNDSVGGTIAWTYDTVSSGHHPRVQETTTPGTVTVEYDEIGRRLKLSATGQTDVTYTYDKNSRLKTVTQGSQTVSLAYDDAGRRTSLTYPNGVVTSYGYDNANRLLTINHVKTPTTIEALTYQYDPASNRVSLNRANAAASLIPAAVSSNSYDAANEQTQFNGVTQTFDANGNLTNDGTNTYTWDARNRLTAISGGVTASFAYDGLGRRKSKTIGGTTTGFWYDGNDILAELNGGTPTVTYIRGLSIDERYIRKGGSDEFYETDALGGTVVLTAPAGTAQTTYTYEPFGNTTQSGTASSNALQYTGRENDGTALYYYRARYYGPQFQRFLTVDPIEFEGGDVNLYAYAQNAPINLADPLGFSAKCPDCVDSCLKNNYGDLADYAFKASIFGLATVAGLEVAAYSAGAKFGVLGGLGVASDLASQSFAKEAANILTSPTANYGKFFGLQARAAAAASSLNVASKLAWFSRVAFTTAQALGNVGAVATVGGTSFYGTAWLYCKWECGQTR